jgi:hypothetical protein
MALSAKVGRFNVGTVTGSLAITGVGFQPKVILFWGNRVTGSTSGGHVEQAIFFGAASSATARATVGSCHSDAGATPGISRAVARAYSATNPAGNNLGEFDVSSFDSDGFTLDRTTAFSADYLVHYLALGGADLTNAFVGEWEKPAASGNQAVTGVGFQPDSVIMFSNRSQRGVATGDADFQMGLATSSSARGYVGLRVRSGLATTQNSRYARSDKFATEMDFFASTSANDATDTQGDFVSFDTDGFTVNWSLADADSNHFYQYVALKGARVKVGNFLTQTSTGNFSVTGVGFQPKALLVVSPCAAESGSNQATAGAEISVGAATASGEQGAMWIECLDNVAPDTASYVDTASVYTNRAAGSFGADAAAALVSFGSDGFTLDQTDADTAQRWALYLALGDAAAAGQTITPTGIDSSAAVGSPVAVQRVAPSGIDSSAAPGTPVVAQSVAPVGIDSSAAVGAPGVLARIRPSGIDSSAALGEPTATITTVITPAGIDSSATPGAPSVLARVGPAGIDSSAGLGAPGLLAQLLPTGIDSTVQVGNPAALLSVVPSGIDSTAALGVHGLLPRLSPAGIDSSAQLGEPFVVAGGAAGWAASFVLDDDGVLSFAADNNGQLVFRADNDGLTYFEADEE